MRDMMEIAAINESDVQATTQKKKDENEEARKKKKTENAKEKKKFNSFRNIT